MKLAKPDTHSDLIKSLPNFKKESFARHMDRQRKQMGSQGHESENGDIAPIADGQRQSKKEKFLQMAEKGMQKQKMLLEKAKER